MADRDELIAEAEHALTRLVNEGHLELATRRGAGSLAVPLLALLEEDPNADIGEWLIERGEVSELYLEPAEVARRFASVFTRLAKDDPAPLHDPELIALIARAPDDEKAWLVYADWLADRNDPRGELIVLQTRRERERLPEATARLDAGEESLFRRWRGHFFGDLPKDDDEQCAITFRRGFFDEAVVADASLAEDVVRLESARFLRALVVRDPSALEAVVAKGPLPPSLVSLTLGTRNKESDRPLELSTPTRGLAGLERLTARAARLRVDGLDLPSLRSLELRGGALAFGPAPTFSLPRLESLTLDVGSIDPDSRAALAKLLDGLPPSVSTVRVSAPFLVDVVRSRLPAQLRTLDLSRASFYSGDALSVLAASRAAFAKLELLDLRSVWMHDPDRQALVGAFACARVGLVDDPTEGEDYEYDEDDDEYDAAERAIEENTDTYEEAAYDEDDRTADDGTLAEDARLPATEAEDDDEDAADDEEDAPGVADYDEEEEPA